ncbi:MAG TPA: GAF domain-containing protein, partial [Rhodocyclaceae bacterium]|nr:GAF domain-containing protein [Rhodocyclaceae bacterium]
AARLTETIDQAKKQLADFAVILGIRLADSVLGRRLGAAVGQSGPTGETLPGALPDRAPEMLVQSDGKSSQDKPVDAGIQDVTNALVDGMSLNDMFRIVLETLYRALAFRRVLLCVRDTRSRMMVGRLGFGEGTDALMPSFRFALDGVDLFNLVLKKGADLLVSNAHEEPVVRRIPDWYKRAVDAETFVLLPLLHKGRPVAMIYADRERAGEIVIAEKELALVRTLRNQALLAIRQASA